ncbi:hypothetical protein A2U01_0098449, partial [Trifolium medium]|nr:hypothetical protein [Trifolium medium]
RSVFGGIAAERMHHAENENVGIVVFGQNEILSNVLDLVKREEFLLWRRAV